jgi:hypothetical protein
MKQEYEKPEAEIIVFETEDVVYTSPRDNEGSMFTDF